MTLFRFTAFTVLILPVLTHCTPTGNHYLPGYDAIPQDVITAQAPDDAHTQMEVQ